MSQATEREQKADLRLIAAELGHIAHTCERLAGTEDELTRRDHSLRVLLGDFAGRRDDIEMAADGLLQALNDLRTHNDRNLPAISTTESLRAFEATLQETLKHYDYADAHGLGDLKHGVEHELGYIRRALDLPIGLLRHITRLGDLLDDVPLAPKDETSLRQVLAELKANPARSSTLTRILPAWRARSAALYKEMKAHALWLTPTQVDTVLVVENEDSWQQDIRHLVLDPLRNEYSFEVQLCETKRRAMDWLVARAELPVEMKANYQADPHGFWPEVESWLRENRSRRHLARTLLVCDLSIPSEAGTAASPVNGREVARFCRDLMPVIVLTTHGSLFDELVRVGHPEVDFVEKGGPSEYPDEWADSLQERVRAHLSPLPMKDCHLEALAFTGSMVVFNGLEVELTSTEYSIIEALSLPRATRWEPAFSRPLLEEWHRRAGDLPYVDLEEVESRLAKLGRSDSGYGGGHFRCAVNEIARRVALRSLPGVEVDSWGEDEATEERVLEHLRAIARQISAAAEASGLPAFDEPLFEVHEAGPERLISLRPHTRVFLDHGAYDDERRQRRDRRSAGLFGILVVEDDPTCAKLVVEALHHQGLPNVLTATTRGEAQRLLEGDQRPDLVILDLEIPAEQDSPSRIDEGLLVRRLAAAGQVPPHVIIFTAHSRESVYAKLARVESRADWVMYLAARRRAFLQKNGGDLAESAAQVAREAARAYRVGRRGNWSDVLPTEEMRLHRVIVPPLPWPPISDDAVPMRFWVDDTPVDLPDRNVKSEFTDPRRAMAMCFLNLLARHDNFPLHADWLTLELVAAGVFSTEGRRTGGGEVGLPNYRQNLDRCLGILRTGLQRSGVKDGEVLISTGNTYQLSGVVSIG